MITIKFADKAVEAKSLKVTGTYSDHLEGTYESISKYVLKKEKGMAAECGKGYWLLAPEMQEKEGFSNCLPDYRIEISMTDYVGGFVEDLKVVFFANLDSTDDLARFLNSTFNTIRFADHARKWDLDDL